MSIFRSPASVILCALLLAAATRLHGQAIAIRAPQEAGSGGTPAASNGDEGPAGIIPYRKGYQVSLGTTSQHDSANGWSSLLTPDVAYRFNQHFSVDATTPIFTYINVLTTGGTSARPTTTYNTMHFAPGDTSLNVHYETNLFLEYTLTATAGLPTGNSKNGLGAGQATYNLNNHFERSLGLITPDLELGIGDASDLVAEVVRKSYTAVGPLAYFQAGATVALPRDLSFTADAYEELPIANATVFSTTGRGRKKTTTSHIEGPAEDNGFLTTLDIPLSGHVTLSGFYNRSLRSHIDTAGFSFTFLLKAPPKDVLR